MDGLVLPDLTKPLTKKLKEESIKIEKLYVPFMESFFGQNNGAFTTAVSNMVDDILNKLANMFEVMQGLYQEAEETNERERRKEDPQEEKKKSWIMEKWQKVIKTGFFQKTLGFLKGLASVDFITQVLTFLLLLRLGIFQRFFPLITDVVGSALESLVKAIPKIVMWIWNMLSKRLPRILKSLFDEALKTLGLENKGFDVLAGVLAKGLPMLLAMVWLFSKLGPVISALSSFHVFIKAFPAMVKGAIISLGKLILAPFKLVGSLLGLIGLGVIKLLALVGIVVTLPAWIVGAIAVAVVAIGALIWKFREQIGNFFSNLGQDIKEVFFSVIGSIGDFFAGLWEGIKEIFFGLVASIGEFIASAWHSIIVDPIKRIFGAMRRMADPVLKKLSPIIRVISSIFTTIGTKITSMIDSIKSALDSMLDWFSDVSTFGAVDWMTMEGDKKQAFKSTRASLRENALVQFASGEITESEAASKLGIKDGSLTPQQMEEVKRLRSLQTGDFKNTDIATILAASMEGVIDKISSKSGSQKRIVSTLTFVRNTSATGANK